MMLVDHIACGLLLPNVAKKYSNSVAVVISVLSGISPDIPVIFSGGLGTVGYLSHRTATHSLMLAPFFCILPLIIIHLIFRRYLKNNILQLYLLSFVAYCGHIFLDLLTPFGTRLLYPFSHKIYCLDYFHSFDPIFMIISMSLIVLFLKKIRSRKFLNSSVILIFLGLYLAYAGITGVRKYSFSDKYKVYINKHFSDACYVDTIPRTFWRWKGIAKTTNTFVVVAEEEPDEVIHKVYPMLDNLPNYVKTDRYYLQFIDYARFPIIIPETKKINIINLVYSPESYRLILKLDDVGNIVEYEVTGFKILDRKI